MGTVVLFPAYATGAALETQSDGRNFVKKVSPRSGERFFHLM
jgi:hypothetical protein